jgi:DNA-binding YbaB/EbfC family protein
MSGGFGNMMKQAEALQRNMQKAQEEVARLEVTGESGGGMVKVTMTGKHEVRRVQIEPAVVGEDRAACVEVIRASNQAGRDGCGCDSPGSAPGALGALTGLAVALVRRRARR